ncbi:MAG TPA: glutamyl-tRNA reductase [Ferruginibacter sp.]|nr:glutamyl-tRNA reductase [Ferruginibacter sp.]
MDKQHVPDISNFFITGISYRKSDAFTRGRFAVNAERYKDIIHAATQYKIHSFFVLSTCNRTEIYGFTDDVHLLKALLCSVTEGSAGEFNELCYTKTGEEAMEHLFNVASGLDSQVLGDYEIVGQLKNAVKFSKTAGFIDVYMERMVNEVLQASRNIRTNTSFSGGSVSISFAAVQFAKNYYRSSIPSILLVGTGKMGRNTCKNIVDHFPGSPVVLINRTPSKAESLALEYSLRHEVLENLYSAIAGADIILVATDSGKPFIFPGHFEKTHSRLIIDLSVPCNVDPSVGDLPGILLVNVDELSRVKDETLLNRAAEIPKVKAIISAHIKSYLEWYEMRKHVPVLRKVKNHLLKIQSGMLPEDIGYTEILHNGSDERIQKVISGMAIKMRTQNSCGCHYIEAVNDFIAVSN